MLTLRLIALVLAVTPVASAAHAQPPAQTPSGPVTHFGLTFPTEIGGARRLNVRAFEPDNPGLGYSAGYRRGEVNSTVFVYDNLVSSIPDNLQSAVVRSQFEQAKGDIGRAARENLSIRETNSFSILDAGKRERLICTAYVMTRQPESSMFDSFVCLGVFKGKFLKVRTTMPQAANAESELRRFVGLWVDRLWGPSADR